ncbi:MAG: DNA polymerase III subunit gamma/tau [Elusimicrobiaceae bacterium]|nr:DNA polymerase III subunit gamma/tau [Elusimicrobiaceae bacterium]
MANDMHTDSYVSLANKYRPQKFEDMVGQESISKTLQNALKLGRMAHAYLFYGPRGCGKTTTARILAKALNCTGHGEDKPTAEPCGKCPQCREIAQSADMDVLEIDAASNTGIDNVREVIIDTVSLASGRDRFKVFILDEVHMLSTGAFNALLKTIEEPPAHVVFILATTEKHKVPATIVSRCQTFRFRPLTVDEITTHLLDLSGAENIDLTPAAAKIIAKNAGGAMRDALTLLDRAIAYSGNRIDEKSVGDMLGLTPDELIKQAVRALIEKDNQSLHQVFDTLKSEGFDANSFLKDLKNALGEAFYFSLGQGAAPFEGAEQVLDGVSPGLLAQISRKINKIIEEVKFSDNALISAEVGLFTVMESCLDLEGFVRRLEALERGEVNSNDNPPASSTQNAPRRAVKTTPPPAAGGTSFAKSSTAEKPIPTPKAEEPVQGTIPNRQLWEKMLQHFEKSPFVYDVMLNCSVAFEENRWTLSFAEEKAFYHIPAQSKLAELEEAAWKLGGRRISINLSDSPATTVTKKTIAQQPVKKAQPAAEILDETPLSTDDFSAEIIAPTAETDVPEELKEVLEVIPGELLA